MVILEAAGCGAVDLNQGLGDWKNISSIDGLNPSLIACFLSLFSPGNLPGWHPISII